MPFALLDHAGDERPVAVDDTPEVHAHHPLPCANRDEVRVGGFGDAGVVAQHVDATELSEGEISEMIDRSTVGNIGDLADDAGAVSRHLGDGIVELRGLDVAQDDIHALTSETVGKRSAHAAGGARDDGGLVGKILHPSDRTRRPDPLVSLRR